MSSSSARTAPAKRSTDPAEVTVTYLMKQTGAARAVVIGEWKERAAIREYLGGLERGAAEGKAIDDVIAIFEAKKHRQRSLW